MQQFPARMAEDFFKGCSPAAIMGQVTKSQALETAGRFVATHHPTATCAFVFGSAIHDTLGPCSDLDLLIVEPDPVWRGVQRHVFERLPLEAHIFDQRSFRAGVRAAVASGRFNTTFALAECEALTDPTGLGAELQRLVKEALEAGPPPMRREVAGLAHCAIATSLIELATNASEDERFATILRLQPMMMDFYFAGRREWAKGRKWAVRDAPAFSRRLHQALQEAWRTGDVDDLTAILGELAAPWPGLCWNAAHVRDRA